MKVLVTEDCEYIQSIYRSVFARYDFIELDFADSPQASRQKFRNDHYDFAFFDVDLGDPTTDGRQLSHEFHDGEPDAQVVMATSHAEKGFLRWSRDHGFRTLTKDGNFIAQLRKTCGELEAHTA